MDEVRFRELGLFSLEKKMLREFAESSSLEILKTHQAQP